jgi:putative tryptophan/tyrosine transport system permease protein
MISFIQSVIYDFPFYALLSLSFFLSFRVLNFPDLAMDASYAAGMAVLVRSVHEASVTGIPLLIALPFAALLGFVVGAVLATLHGCRFFGLGKLLAGLVISFCMFSVNFRLNLGTSTQGLYTKRHELNALRDFAVRNGMQDHRWLLVALLLVVLAITVFALYLLLRSRAGLYLRVAGHRPHLLVEGGRRPLLYAVVGLGLANVLSAFVGCLRAACDNYSDVNSFGTFLYALAALLLGERAVGIVPWAKRHSLSIVCQLAAPVLGGLMMSLLLQVSVWLLSDVLQVYHSPDIKFVVGAAVLLSASRGSLRLGKADNSESFGRRRSRRTQGRHGRLPGELAGGPGRARLELA